MQALCFVELEISGVALEDLARQAAEWVLGQGAFKKLQKRRRGIGVPSGVSPEAVCEGGDFRGKDDCIVRVRRTVDNDRWIIHFSHRHDPDKPKSPTWHNITTLQRSGMGTRVTQRTGRVFPKRGSRNLPYSAPKLVRHFVETYADKISPKEAFQGVPIPISSQTAQSTLDTILLNPRRRLPIVVCAVNHETREHCVDPQKLASRLEGIATVLTLDTPQATLSLTRALRCRGCDTRLAVYNGAIRFFHLHFSKADSPFRHPLWIPRLRFLNKTAEQLLEILSGQICHIVALRAQPHTWASMIGAFDVENWRSAFKEFAQRTSALLAEGTLEEVRAEAQLLSARLLENENVIQQLERDRDLAYNARQETLEDMQELQNERDALYTQLSETYRIDSARCVLRTARSMFGSRLEILDSVERTIQNTQCDPQELFLVLQCLGLSGGDNALVQKLLMINLGDRVQWRSADNAQTVHHFGEERTFSVSRDEAVLFSKHINVGDVADPQQYTQVYYRSVGTRVQVAYCGPPLRTAHPSPV